MKVLIFVLLVSVTITGRGLASDRVTCESSSTLEALFRQERVVGTLVVYDGDAGLCVCWNADRAQEQLYPASTFKLFHALIGLDKGVVRSVDDVFYHYQGEKVFLESWKKDASLRSAIRDSQVPAFRELARRIGPERMKEGLISLDYGNKEIGTNLDSFWLAGPLKISAMEQARLLYELARKRLPLSKSDQDAVIETALKDRGEGWALYGKTGWATDNVSTPVGWFVGWLEKEDGLYSFAFNMDLEDSKRLPDRERLVQAALKELGIL